MKTHPATGKELIPPLWYAIGAIAATPLVALCMVMAGILMILGWPFIPILCYFQRKEEISKANVKVHTPLPASANSETEVKP